MPVAKIAVGAVARHRVQVGDRHLDRRAGMALLKAHERILGQLLRQMGEMHDVSDVFAERAVMPVEERLEVGEIV